MQGIESIKEMPGVENLSKLNLALQHEEEVQRYIEAGNLKPHEVALYVMAHGSNGQKISMLQHLDRTVKECEEKNVVQIMNIISECWKEDIEVQVAAPAAVITILPLLSAANVQTLFTNVAAMLEVRAEEVRKAWSELTLALVDVLSPAFVLKEVVPFALRKSEHSEPQDQRILCCALIGKIGTRLSPQQVVDTVLTKALALCQDTDSGVRVGMCNHLAVVSRAVGLEVTKARITHELFELLVDEEKLVSRAAFTSLIDLVEFFDPPYRREHFYPIIRSYISSPPDEVLTLLIEEFGRFLWKIKSDIQGAEDTILFANFFRQCAQKPDEDVRKMCAYNLPAVVASLKGTYSTHLTQITRSLAVDPNKLVRRSVAAGLHELFILLAEKASYFLKEPFIALLSDSAVDVRTLLVQHLDPMLRVFSTSLKGDERDAFFAQITPAIVNYEVAIQKDWRKVAVLLKSFPSIPDYFPAQTVYDKFMPILVRHLQYGAAALKPLCAEYIVLYSKKIDNVHLAVNVFSKVIGDTFGRSLSCYNRLGYIMLFEECAKKYSRKFQRDRLLEILCSLAEDPVPRVRASVARIAPKLKVLLRPPVDDESSKQIQKALGKLQQDSHPEVQSVWSGVVKELDDLDKEISRLAVLRVGNAADEAAEKALEDTEGTLLELAREQEKNERREKIREMLKETMSNEPGKRVVPKRGGASGLTRPALSTASTSATTYRSAPSTYSTPSLPPISKGSPKVGGLTRK